VDFEQPKTNRRKEADELMEMGAERMLIDDIQLDLDSLNPALLLS
jgi:hypothetical protein